MEEPYGEGLSSHTGPESCEVVREGSGEALTGVRAGRLWSRETPFASGVPTPSPGAEGHTGRLVSARGVPGSTRSETPSTHGSTSRGTREIPRLAWEMLPRAEQ